MTEPHWTSYVGMATGIVGAITGITGAIMGYLSYRKSKSLKSLDLRIELRKALNNLQSDLSQLEEFIERANQSRIAVSSAMGMFHSGAMEKWKEDVETDKRRARQLVQNAPPANKNYDDLTTKKLESELVEAHRLQVQADELRKKYEEAIRADEEERKLIRQSAAARFPPR